MTDSLHVGITRHAAKRARERLGRDLPFVWWREIAKRGRSGVLRAWSYRRKDNRGEVRWRVPVVSFEGEELDLSICAGIRWRDDTICEVKFISIWVDGDEDGALP